MVQVERLKNYLSELMYAVESLELDETTVTNKKHFRDILELNEKMKEELNYM